MKRWIAIAILIAIVVAGLAITITVVSTPAKEQEEIEVPTETQIETEAPTKVIEETVKETIEETEPATEEDLSYLVTSVQYTLGYGVRARLSPSQDGKIFKVINDIYTPVDTIEEGRDYYTCLIDNTVVYIYWKYIGDEQDIEYVKAKRAKEEKMKASAYYRVFENMTDEDYDLLARILAIEAGYEPWQGKLAVVEVVMNRMISKNPGWHKSSVTACLRQAGQFDSVNYLSHPHKYPDANDYAAIQYVKENGPTAIRKMLDEAGMTNINSLDYVFFATYKANGRDFVKYGNHYFSRETKSAYWHTPCK